LTRKQKIKWVIQKLRRISVQYPTRSAAKTAARLERGVYICAHCSELFRPKEIHVDHIDPVIEPSVGFVDWNTYIDRLFPKLSGFQVLCKACHKIKSDIEDEIRNEFRRKKREERKK
jgi:5-methylcytosine-specific restriction endonuclease McrA